MIELEKTELKKFVDFFVKVKRVFSEDVYIINNRYVIAGENSEHKLSGMIVLEIDPSYKEVLSKVFFPDGIIRNVFIPNIVDIKTELGKFQYLQDEEYETQIKQRMEEFDVFSKPECEWRKFHLHEDSLENERLLSLFFTDKLMGRIISNDEHIPDVQIGPSFLPGVTIKTISDLEYYMGIYKVLEKETIYQIVFKYYFTHYNMWIRYFFI